MQAFAHSQAYPTPQPVDAEAANYQHTSRDELIAALETLSRDKQELEAKRYIDASIARFGELMRWKVEYTLEFWADQFLQELVPFLKGLEAALYVIDAEQGQQTYLRLVASYATPPTLRTSLALGEGITGQVAKSRLPSYFLSPSAFRSATFSSLTEVQAQTLLVQPLLQNDQVEGVLELSALAPFTEAEMEVLRLLSEDLAANLSTIRNQLRIQQLYKETQERTELLAAQEEAMRQNIEELEASQDALRVVQQEAAENGNRLASILNSTTDQVMLVDSNFTVQYVNRIMLQEAPRLQSSLEVGKSFFDCIPPEAIPRWQAYHMRALEGKQFSVEDHFDRAGQPHHAELYFNPIVDATQQITGFSVFRRDVTERWILQQELDQQQARLASILNSTTDQVALLDANFLIIYTNEPYQLHLEQRGYELRLGTPLLSYVTPSLQAKVEAALHTLARGKAAALEVEEENNGRRDYYELFFNPIFGQDEKIVGFSLFRRDISQRKLAEAQVREKEAQLQALINNTDDSISSLDRNYRIVVVNEVVRSRYARVGKELAPGADMLSYLDPATAEEWKAYYDRALGGERFSMTLAYTLEGGARQFRDYSLNPIRWQDGSVQGVSIYSRDVTEKTLQQEELKQTLEQLQASEEELRQNLDELASAQTEMARQKALVDSLIESSDEALLVVDEAYQVLLLNKKAEVDFSQGKRKARLGAPIVELLPTGQVGFYQQHLAQAFEGHKTVEVQHISTKKGDRFFEVNFFPIRTNQGKVIAAAAASREVTQQRQVQQQQAQQLALFEALVESSSDAISVIDRNLNVLFVNPTLEGLYKASGIDFQPGDPLAKFLPPKHLDYHLGLYKRALAGERFTERVRFKARDGQYHYYENNYFAIHRGEEIIAAGTVTRDVTHRTSEADFITR